MGGDGRAADHPGDFRPASTGWPAERAVIERGAIIGRELWVDAVQELSPDELRPTVEQHLMSLVRKELVRGAASSLPGHEAFTFRHSLIRDAAYRAMPKELRFDLHARFGAWLERTGAEAFAEIIGYHFEQSYRYRAELGLLDADAELTGWPSGRPTCSRGAGVALRPRRPRRLRPACSTGPSGSRTGDRLEPSDRARRSIQALGQLDQACGRGAGAGLRGRPPRGRPAGARGEPRARPARPPGARRPEFGVKEMRAAAEAALAIFEELGDELGGARVACGPRPSVDLTAAAGGSAPRR